MNAPKVVPLAIEDIESLDASALRALFEETGAGRALLSALESANAPDCVVRGVQNSETSHLVNSF